MTASVKEVALAVVLVSLSCTMAAAQATATISGTVVDSAGGVIPGATVVVANKATNTKFTAVTDGTGAFAVPALDSGNYSITVSLIGFKTAVLDDVRLQPGFPAAVRAVLDVGTLEVFFFFDWVSSEIFTRTLSCSAVRSCSYLPSACFFWSTPGCQKSVRKLPPRGWCQPCRFQ